MTTAESIMIFLAAGRITGREAAARLAILNGRD
jgi:hypothetical protein